MYKNKEIKVVFSEDANEVYKEINSNAGKEKINGIDSSINQTLLRSIQRAIELLKENPFTGNQIPKNLIPKEYVSKYGINNVWRIELADRWRLIYTLDGDEIKIITFVLEILITESMIKDLDINTRKSRYPLIYD